MENIYNANDDPYSPFLHIGTLNVLQDTDDDLIFLDILPIMLEH